MGILDHNEIVYGYHGTFESAVKDIIDSGFTAKKRDDHWLGQGIYLYTDFGLSKWWIETKIGNLFLNEEPAVIKVVCKDNLNVLNLDCYKGIDFFFNASKEVFEELKKMNITLKLKKSTDPKDKIKNLCFALDLVKKKYDIGAVIYTFTKTNPSYGEYNIKRFEDEVFPFGLSYKETQICISSNECISNKQCVYPISKYEYNNINEEILLKKKGRLI